MNQEQPIQQSIPPPPPPMPPLPPQQTPVPTPPSSASPPPNGITPGYGKRKDGEVQNLAVVPDEFMRLFEHDPSEIILVQALKHQIGVLIIYLLTGLVIFALLLGTGLLVADTSLLGSANLSQNNLGVGLVITLFLSVLIAGIGFAATIVYQKSRLILTNQKLVLFVTIVY